MLKKYTKSILALSFLMLFCFLLSCLSPKKESPEDQKILVKEIQNTNEITDIHLIDAMAEGAVLRTDSSNSLSGWDAGGFRIGVQDMMDVEMTIPGIQAFAKSDKCRVEHEELKKIYKELGFDQPSVLLVK